MSLQDQRSAFDGGGVGAFATLGEALSDQALWLGEQRDALAGVAFAAGIVCEPLAIGCLREQPRQRVLADTSRSRKEQSMRHAARTHRTAKRRHDLGIAAEFGEGHR
jgi:hypothetical protein